jgi:hypothetical protein
MIVLFAKKMKAPKVFGQWTKISLNHIMLELQGQHYRLLSEKTNNVNGHL